MHKIDLRKSNKYIALSNFSISYTWKNIKIKKDSRKTNFKYVGQRGMKNLSYLMDNIQVSDIQNYFEYIIKKHETVADNSPIKIYVNKTNR